jgi:hypothetical protein
VTVQHQFAIRYPDLAVFPREVDERIAEQGLHLRTQKEIQVGERVGLQFRFPQREDPLLAVGAVGWVSAQPDEQGRRSLVVRDIVFDAASQQILDLVRRTPAVEEAEHVRAAAVPPRAAEPPPAAAPAAPQAARPVPAATATAAAIDVTEAPEGDADARKRRIFIALAVLLVLLGSAAGWLFGLGGWRYVAMALLNPPALSMPEAPAVRGGVEPPLPEPVVVAAPPPKPIPPAVATSFDYFQRPGRNEFTISFNRAPRRVFTSRTTSPLVQTFYVERARVNLDKAQYFLPYDLVRTVTFEEEGGNLRISFLAQRPDWLPNPIWELRGRELVVRFVASD